MSDTALSSPRTNLNPFAGLMSGTVGPVTVVVLAILAIWYIAAAALNPPFQQEMYARAGQGHVQFTQLIADTWAQERPVLPAPHQVVIEIWNTTVEKKITSKRSLIYHSSITLSSTLLGFLIGTTLGILLAVGIVHSRVLDKSLMPWIISSQTIPILAIAPMIIVVLNAVGISGLLPKALISTYLSFFPVVVGMVAGLRAPERADLDLMHTYSASYWQTLATLRLPAALPFVFNGLKVSATLALIGAIVAEFFGSPTVGLGFRINASLGQLALDMVWAVIVVAAIAGSLLYGVLTVLERKLTFWHPSQRQ